MTQLPFIATRRRIRAATALSPVSKGAGLAALLLIAPLTVWAQEAPAPAPNPVVPVQGGGTRLDYGANGVPVVKIAAPDARGTSYNRYDAFNVDGRGVVLNNSDKIVQSRLAGFIDGNSALKASGGANLIINEVVSANPSRIAGYLEVAGRPADLILANPYGITCDGCGFVNAPRITLAVGAPQLTDGAVGGFRTSSGALNVIGRGLDATNARLELFARAVTINAGIYADSVTASFGTGDITRDGELVVTGKRNPAAADQPVFGLDVAALGGMYAKSIRLIGTEAGLGVNVSGELAGLEQGISLSSDGRVSIGGIVTAKTDAAIETIGPLDVAGQLYAEGKTTLKVGTLTSGGLIGSGGDLTVSAGGITSSGTIAAGLNRAGGIAQAGSVALTSGGTANLSGRVLARDGLAVNAASIRNAGLVSGGSVTSRSDALDNSGGVIDGKTALDARTGAITNVGGAIQSGGALTLTGSALANERGAVLGLGDGKVTVDVRGVVAGVDGQIGGNGDVSLTAASLSVSGAKGSVTAGKALTVLSSGGIDVTANALIASGGAADIAAGTTTNITAGAIQSGGALALRSNALTVGSAGQVSGGSGSIVTRGGLTNAGLIASTGRIDVNAGALSNTGTIAADAGLSFTVLGDLSTSGLIASDAGIAMQAGSLTASGGTVQAGGPLTITTNLATLDKATVLALGSGGLSLASTGAFSATGSRLGGNGDVAFSGTTIDLIGTRVTALGGLTLDATAGDLALTDAATLENAGDLTLRASGTLSHTSDIVGRGSNLTLSAARIDNRAGSILHLGNGALTVIGASAVDNTSGTIGTNGTLALSAGTLANGSGRITAAGSVALNLNGAIENGSGLVSSGAGLTVRAGAVTNTGGSIETSGVLDASAASLDGGTLVAAGAAGKLTLDVTGAINGGVLIGAATDAAIAAGSVNLATGARLTAGGGLTATMRSGDLSLNGGTIDAANVSLTSAGSIATGNGGAVQSTGTLTLDAGEGIVTTGGRMVAGGALTAKAATIDNRTGLLVSGPGGATFIATTVQNAGGTLGGDGAVSLTATTLDNGAGVLAAGTDLTLTTINLANATGGQLWADQDGRISVSGTVTNRGSIAASRDLVLNTGTLDGSTGSGAGTLAGGRLLEVNSGGGTTGKLVAPNALTLGITGDLSNAADDTISTPGALTLNIGGSFANAGRVEGGSVGVTTGGSIANQASGSIVAGTINLAAGTSLDNAGLINGGDVTLRGASIANSGAIFADRAALFGAGGITNAGSNAVIATRGGLLQLSSGGDIVNYYGALLYSLGNIAVTGADGTGRAASLTNLSANIQAQGDIAIGATRVVNDRASFTTEEALLSSQYVENADRRDREHRTLTKYTEIVTDTRITADSGEAQIIGGNISIDADSLTNNISTISASGNLNVGAAVVSNTAFTGYNTTTQTGTIEDQKRSCFLFFCGDWDTRSTTPLNTVNPVATFTIASTLTAGGTLAIDAKTIDNVVLTPGGGSADIFAASATPGTVSAGAALAAGGLAAVTAPGTAPGTIAGTTIDPSFGFAVLPLNDRAGGGAGAATLDLGGLFKYAESTSLFLVEADPRFSNYQNFVSSDYFLDRLGYDPTRVQRRLGDGLYEQQLISNQLVALVGAQRLTGYADNQAQYRALLDAGATYAQQYQLALGVGLSPAQMATLTSDIVLLVETTVQTLSGPQTVLAPRVYLTKAATGDLTSGGAIIAGRDLQLRASDSFANAGVVRATASSTIVGGTVTNTGRLDLGNRAVVAASGDLTDRGGAITAGDLTLSAGRDLTLAPVAITRTVATRYYADRSDQQVSLATTTINRGTDLSASGNVNLLAGRSVSVTGANVAAGGDLAIQGGQDVAIRSATDTGSSFAIGRQGKTQFKQTQTEQANVLSTLNAGGNVSIATPGALTVSGAEVTAGKALTADAGSIAVTGVVDSTRLQRDTLKKSGGLLSSTKTTTTYDGTDQRVVASTLAGDTVALRSQGETRIAGSNVVANNGVGIQSGGAIDVGTLTATDTEAQSTRVKKSGLSFGGGGLFLGVAKNRNDVNTTSTTNTGSLIGSTAGDVTLDATRDLTVTGSQVVGNGTTRLTGERVTVQNETDTVQTDTLSKSSSIGLSVGVQNPVLSGLSGVRDSARVLGSGNTNARTTAVAGLAGGLAAYNAADALSVGGANVADTARNLTSVGVSFGVSSSKSTSSTTDQTNLASRVAGQDVVIAARGAGPASTITVQGSEVVAQRDLTLLAPGAITLRSGTEADTLAQANKSSGFSVGVQLGLNGGITPSASLNLGKGSASGTDVRQTESLVSAGNQVRIATPEALTLQGAQVSGNRVSVDAGSLAIISEQDRAAYVERQRNLGLSVSIAGGGSIGGNLNNSRQNGEYASVREQSGIFAGSGGYDINVAGNTNLVGGVIASEAGAERNRLSTGTLTASDIANTESYRANSTTLGGGIGGIGKNNDGLATAGTDRTPGSQLPGLRTGIGTISATPPLALNAKGSQSGTTSSAIAPGTIAITSGDAASRDLAATISRDTAGANAGALIQQYDAEKREEIALGFAAATQLANQTGTFFANRATEEQILRDQARRTNDPAEAARLTERADALRDTYGAGSSARLIATALNGGAGSGVTGSLGGLVQASAVNVLQGLAATAVKDQVDLIANPRDREVTRAALQAVFGCAGSVAGGSGGCGSAATGAAASVVLNNLLQSGTSATVGPDGKPLTIDQQEARSSLVATIVTGLGEALGAASPAATLAAQIETENNSANGRNYVKGGVTPFTPAQLASVNGFFRGKYEALGSTDQARAERLQKIIDCAASSSCKVSDPVELAAFNAWVDVANDKVRTASNNRALNDRLVEALSQNDPAMAEKLAGQSQAVLTQVRTDLASGRGNNVVGRISGGILSTFLSEDQIADLYLANVSDRVGERKGSFDKALTRGMTNAAQTATSARQAADVQAADMRRNGVPEALVQTYLFKEYYNAAATERTAVGLLGQVQLIGDYLTDPARVSGKAAQGAVQGIDNVLLDDTSAAEYLRRAGGAVDRFAASSVTSKATTLGNTTGDVAVAAVDAAVAKGTSAAATRVAASLDAASALRAARAIAPDVATPYGPAVQSLQADAIAMRARVEGGATLYRIGKMGRSEGADAQFWSLEYPLSPGYADKYGIPAANIAGADFIETATLKPGQPFITRPAPPVGANRGGGIEVVVPSNGVTMKYFGGK
ncbi:hypothetical protein NS277_07020 [Novosphingobium barchaimii]|nr:hypothetical protein NS277_07020 [Novosphingobium barchaimii]